MTSQYVVNSRSQLTFKQAGVIPGAQWNATEGWDPTTGFGVPNFEKLLQLTNFF
jgi:tripeptidyl-peptidase-1